MDKLQKFLNRLSPSEQQKIAELIDMILSNVTKGLDIKKLKGYQDIYRVRSGGIRIIFRRLPDDIKVLDVGRRSEKTYRDY